MSEVLIIDYGIPIPEPENTITTHDRVRDQIIGLMDLARPGGSVLIYGVSESIVRSICRMMVPVDHVNVFVIRESGKAVRVWKRAESPYWRAANTTVHQRVFG